MRPKLGQQHLSLCDGISVCIDLASERRHRMGFVWDCPPNPEIGHARLRDQSKDRWARSGIHLIPVFALLDLIGKPVLVMIEREFVECSLGRISATVYATLCSTAALLMRPSDIYRVAPPTL